MLENIIKEVKFITKGQISTLFNSSNKITELIKESINSYNGENIKIIIDNEQPENLNLKNSLTLSENTIIYYDNPQEKSNFHVSIYNIETVEQYIEIIDNLVKSSSIFENEIFYRGHGNINYIPTPSLFRKKYDYENEKIKLINRLREYSNPNLNIDSSINKLKYIQHYNTNTRLMDLTEDPLTSLFFAVEGDSKNDAEVLIYQISQSHVKYDNSDKVAILSSLSKLENDKKIEIEDIISKEMRQNQDFEIDYHLNNQEIEKYLSKMELYNIAIEKFNEYPSIQHLIHEISKERPHFQSRINPLDLINPVYVKSTWDNDRVISQRGSFVIAPLNDTRFYKNIKAVIEEINGAMDEELAKTLRFITGNINFIARTNEDRYIDNKYIIIRIKGLTKPKIKQTLEKLNINQSRIYPSLKEVIVYNVDLSKRADNN